MNCLWRFSTRRTTGLLSVCMLLALSVTAFGQQPWKPYPVLPPSQPSADAAERQALLERLKTLQAEVDQIRAVTGDTPQVLLSIKIFEVSLTKLRSLGYDVTKLGAAKKDGDTLRFQSIDGNEARQLIESLRKDNLVKVIAEPTLVTLSGRAVAYDSGGELPCPVPQKDGTTAVEFKRFGTHAGVTADVLDEHTVRLSFNCRLADLDYRQSVKIGTESVPGIQAREVSSSLEARDGQTLALTGLTEVREEPAVEGMPIVSELPGIGALFRTTKTARNEIATVFLVRPEIIKAGAGATSTAAGRAPDAASLPTMAPRPADGNFRR